MSVARHSGTRGVLWQDPAMRSLHGLDNDHRPTKLSNKFGVQENDALVSRVRW